MKVRTHGESGPPVVLLHGGPGAPGYLAPVGRGLAGRFRVLEPFQRSSGGAPLTVGRHVEDLRELLATCCPGRRPALVGSSWGAMLGLAFAVAHSSQVGPIVLVGCGTFDPAARQVMHDRIAGRTPDELRRRLARLPETHPDPDERLQVLGDLLLPIYSYDPEPMALEVERCDSRGYRETWDDMLRLQSEGVYPAAFSAIRAPVLMLHGAVDPHPGPMIRASLEPSLPQLEYREWERCGHYPWLEKAVREEFFAVLCEWLSRHSIRDDSQGWLG